MLRFNKKKLFLPLVFLFFLIIVFVFYKSHLFAYFEADEWFHFTYYFPLTQKPDGLFTAFISTFINNDPLSRGQHVVPIASVIYFLNTKFFGMNYMPYAFMSLLLHTINSFLIFFLIKILFPGNSNIEYRNSKQIQITKKLKKQKRLENLKIKILEIVSDFGFRISDLYALMGGLFFALAPTPVHTITGAAPFYGQNILSVTFFIVSLILFKLAYNYKSKKIIYFLMVSVLAALFTKETAVFLFLLLPLMAIFEKRVFPVTFLSKVFVFCIGFYLVVRFVIPSMQVVPQMVDNWIVGNYSSSYQDTKEIVMRPSNSDSIVNGDLSIHKNLPGEILFRTATFPFKMIGTVFVPRETILEIVRFITPVVIPVPSGGDHTPQLGFVYGAGNYVVIYFLSIAIFIFCIKQIIHFVRKKKIEEARTLLFGLTIIILSALPLVAIIFSFPRWGYDFYFDSRFYYNPAVGAAIVFPFLIVGIASFVGKISRLKFILLISIIVCAIWLTYTTSIMYSNVTGAANKFSADRREVAEQIKEILPVLPKKIIFFIETDGLGAYGPVLPFQTGVPQALSLIYYDTSPLPDSFFNRTILNGKPEGYQYEDGRGFGYYVSKKNLADALLQNKFTVDDIYAFYYDSQKVKLKEITRAIRVEMKEHLKKRKQLADWKLFEASPSVQEKLTFLYPPDTDIVNNPIATTEAKVLKDIQINHPQFVASLKVIRTIATVDPNELMGFFGKLNDAELPVTKKVILDRYHLNDVFVSTVLSDTYYILKFDDLLIASKIQNINEEATALLEKMLGSLIITK